MGDFRSGENRGSRLTSSPAEDHMVCLLAALSKRAANPVLEFEKKMASGLEQT